MNTDTRAPATAHATLSGSDRIRRWRRELDARIDLQQPLPSREAIADLAAVFDDEQLRDVRTRVWRNHAFEPLAGLVGAFARAAGYRATFELTDYDDALSFAADGGPADLELVHFDADRLKLHGDQRSQWIEQRLHLLVQAAGTPVLACVMSDDPPAIAQGDGYRVLWVDEAAADIDGPVADDRLMRLAGTRMSRDAQCAVAQRLGFSWIPAAAGRPVKLIVLDLDDTLHAGVLGERGLDVEVTEQHRALQHHLVELTSAGVLLAIASKNDPDDVAKLLESHPDYVLRHEHLVATEASWGPKPEAIARIIETVNIGPDAVVFVDDNTAELASVVSAVHDVGTIDAGRGPAATLRSLELQPGLTRVRADRAADERRDDIVANEERQRLLGNRVADYLAAAEPQITFLVDDPDTWVRLGDLSERTNQFNMTLNRTRPDEFRDAADATSRCTVAAHFADSFSDSGVVLGLLASRPDSGDPTAVVDELFLSCRALGRGLEDAAIGSALTRACEVLGADSVTIPWRRGPRNAPALAWLERLALGGAAGEAGTLNVPLSTCHDLAQPPSGVTYAP